MRGRRLLFTCLDVFGAGHLPRGSSDPLAIPGMLEIKELQEMCQSECTMYCTVLYCMYCTVGLF